MAISQDFLYQLKQNIDIVDLANSFSNLKRSGRNYTGLCPFHGEKTPSFFVYPETQSFYCFGCGAGGDSITFAMQAENLDYIEAVRYLASRAGMSVPEDGVDDSMSKLRKRLLSLNKEAAKHYFETLNSPSGAPALSYLRKRGLSDGTIKKFGLGYAPESWNFMVDYLKGKGYTLSEIQQSNLGVKSKKGSVYDQFRNRVIFPIIDVRGNVVAFGGRTLSERGPKYLNSAETPVFTKSKQLFALNKAKNTKEEAFILAEGYMDVISLHQAGFENTVATLGTALTTNQAQIVAKYVKEVLLCYDSDEAGQKATRRAIDILEKAGLKTKIIELGESKDPDEYIKKNGAIRFKLKLEGSDSAVQFQLNQIKKTVDMYTPEGRTAYLQEAVKVLANLTSPIERDIYATEIAKETNVQKNVIMESLQTQLKILKGKQRKEEKRKIIDSVTTDLNRDKINPEKAKNLRGAKVEEELIAALLKNPEYAKKVEGQLQEEDFATSFNKLVILEILNGVKQHGDMSISMLSQRFSAEQLAFISKILADKSLMHYTEKDTLQLVQTLKEISQNTIDKQLGNMDSESMNKYIEELKKKKK